MDGFGDVFGGDSRRAADIGDGAGDFEDAIVGARGEAHTRTAISSVRSPDGSSAHSLRITRAGMREL